MSKASNALKQRRLYKAGKKYQKKLRKRELAQAKPELDWAIKFNKKLAKDSHNRFWPEENND